MCCSIVLSNESLCAVTVQLGIACGFDEFRRHWIAGDPQLHRIIINGIGCTKNISVGIGSVSMCANFAEDRAAACLTITVQHVQIVEGVDMHTCVIGDRAQHNELMSTEPRYGAQQWQSMHSKKVLELVEIENSSTSQKGRLDRPQGCIWMCQKSSWVMIVLAEGSDRCP